MMRVQYSHCLAVLYLLSLLLGHMGVPVRGEELQLTEAGGNSTSTPQEDRAEGVGVQVDGEEVQEIEEYTISTSTNKKANRKGSEDSSKSIGKKSKKGKKEKKGKKKKNGKKQGEDSFEPDLSVFIYEDRGTLFTRSMTNEDRLDNAVKTLGALQGTVESINDGVSSPSDSFKVLSQLTGVVAVFVPQAAVVSGVFGLLGALLDDGSGGNDVEKVVTKLITDFAAQVNGRLDRIEDILSSLLDDIRQDSCVRKMDEIFSVHMNIAQFRRDYELLVNYLQDDPKSVFVTNQVESLRNLCGTGIHGNTPMRAIGVMKQWIENSVGLGCMDTFVRTSKPRVNYFISTYVAAIVRYLQEAIYYQGVCDGILDYGSSELITNQIKRDLGAITARLREYEGRVYGDWQQHFSRNGGNARYDVSSAFRFLQDNYNPGYQYKVLRLDQSGSTRYARLYSTDSNRGMFFVDVTRGVGKPNFFSELIVMWKKPNAPKLPSPYAWKNNECPGEFMCYRKIRKCNFLGFNCRDVCERQGDSKHKRHCTSPYHIFHEDLKARNRGLYDNLKRAGAIVILKDWITVSGDIRVFTYVSQAGNAPIKTIHLPGFNREWTASYLDVIYLD